MFDYKFGKPSTAYRLSAKHFSSRVKLGDDPALLPLVLSIEFLDGLEVARTLSRVNKAWARSVAQARVWETYAYSLVPADVVNRLKRLWKTAFRPTKGSKDSEKSSALAKYVFAYVTRKVCSHCWTDTKAIRVCKLLGKPLCCDCQKLPEFTMVTSEQVTVDYKLTTAELREDNVRGLTVPGKHTDGHSLTAYYLSDIERVKEDRGEFGCKRSQHYTGAMQARESELLRHFTEYGVTHRKFLKLCFETEGNPAYNFVRGRSQQGANKIAKRLAGMYLPWLQKTQCFIDLDAEPPAEKKLPQ